MAFNQPVEQTAWRPRFYVRAEQTWNLFRPLLTFTFAGIVEHGVNYEHSCLDKKWYYQKYCREIWLSLLSKGNHQSKCPVCQGVGKLTKVRSQYFMNLPNSNFCALWTKLRIPFDDGDGSLCGEITALQLNKAIQNCNDNFNHYLPKLNEIAHRAFQMGEDILWG